MRILEEVKTFAGILKKTKPPNPLISLGELWVPAKRAEIPSLQYNKQSWELLKGSHDYILSIGTTEVHLSTQLYLNLRDHYRIFAYVRCGDASGMLFSLNLTTSKDAKGIIGLSQRIRFAEGRGKNARFAHAIRQAKVRMLADILTRCGIPVTDNFEIDLGTFSIKQKDFMDTTAPKFLSQFLSVALLKGHLQGNKGYQFTCLPRFDDSFSWKWDSSESILERLSPNKSGRRGVRAIPLALRFQVLERDRGVCCLCGRGRHDDVALHVDHVHPYSLGGLTVLSNLQTLCDECNLGKSNRSATNFRKSRANSRSASQPKAEE
jgi:HNH endonuclease